MHNLWGFRVLGGDESLRISREVGGSVATDVSLEIRRPLPLVVKPFLPGGSVRVDSFAHSFQGYERDASSDRASRG